VGKSAERRILDTIARSSGKVPSVFDIDSDVDSVDSGEEEHVSLFRGGFQAEDSPTGFAERRIAMEIDNEYSESDSFVSESSESTEDPESPTLDSFRTVR
jgi:hypothetical protein